MKPKLLKRRLTMLELKTKGVRISDIVAQLARDYSVSEQCLWSDWRRRAKWMPELLDLEKYGDCADVAEVKMSSVERAAWRIVVNCDNPSAQVGALKLITESVKTQIDILAYKDLQKRLGKVEETVEKKGQKT